MSEAASSAIRDWLDVRSRALGTPLGADPELTACLSVLARTTRARSLLQIGGDGGEMIDLCAALSARSRVAAIAGGAGTEVVASWIGEDVERARAAASRAEALGVRGFRAIVGPPVAVLSQMAEVAEAFGLVILAGPSPATRRWLDAALPRLERQGIVVATQVFADGRAFDLDANGANDAETRALRGFPPYFLGHPQLAATILPIAGGLALGGKLESLVTERGGPR